MNNNKIQYREPFQATISIRVKDIETAANFYSDILGFERGWDEVLDIGWLEINLPLQGLVIGLSKDEGEIKHGSTTLNIGVKDVEETHKYLVSRNVEIFRLNEIPDVVKTLAVFDPDGNKLVFVESLKN
jgi:catechol 2,3-dioxygenase-like lactoylglutathione lyase family enzyme